MKIKVIERFGYSFTGVTVEYFEASEEFVTVTKEVGEYAVKAGFAEMEKVEGDENKELDGKKEPPENTVKIQVEEIAVKTKKSTNKKDLKQAPKNKAL